MNQEPSLHPFDESQPPRQGMSTGAKVGIGCGVVAVLLIIIICLGIFGVGWWFMRQAEQFADDFVNDGYQRVQGQQITLTEPINEPTVYIAQVLVFDTDVNADIAIAAQSAEIRGRVDGDIDFYGQVLTIGPDAVVTGDIRARLAQVIEVRGTVEGEITGTYQALQRRGEP